MLFKEKVKITNVSKTFNSKLIFQNINVSFHQAQIIGILGANGSGKTTFIKILCGLIHPDSGSISINNLDVTCNRSKIMRHIGVLLDGSRCLFWRLSAWHNFVYFCGLKGIFGKTIHKIGVEAFNFFDLWEFRHQKVETFSCGMKQKLSIICALAHNPNVIFLDEPTTGFDHKSRCSFEILIKKLSSENKTIIIASHDKEIIGNVCNRFITIHQGSFYE